MKAEILQLEDEKQWDEFVNNHPLASIHQTSLWGRFQAKIPSRGKYWIIALTEGAHDKNTPEKIIAGTVLIRHALHKGYCWLYAPRGPLLDYENEKAAKEQMQMFLEEAKQIAKKEKAVFLRIDPLLDRHIQYDGQLSMHRSSGDPFLGFRPVLYGFQPQHTLVLDLKKSEEELLREMKPKGRYNIKIAEQKGVKIREIDDSNSKNFAHDLDTFYDLILQTTSRDNFSGHNKNFYKNFLETLKPAKKNTLYLAQYNGKIIAGILMTFFGKTATYYYGASGNENRNVMAPYLLQWHAIKEAKKNGLEIYDFFGIAPSELGVFQHAHPWQGVTDFKRKFGGQEISFAPAQEYPFKKFLYFLYGLYKKIKN